MTKQKPLVIAIVGPTASGKTALSLAIAQRLEAEIIACDSRTVYRQFDIGTAKPSAEEQAQVRHHLIDVADPDENFTVAKFAEQSGQAITDMLARGKLPIVCGGTGFYSRVLLEGLVMPDVQPQEQLRAELQEFAEREGNEALHLRLQKVDPQAAAKVGTNDRFRIVRALEVCQTTGLPFSEVARKVEPPFRTIWIGLTAQDRLLLHAAIRTRQYLLMESGLLAETERLYRLYGRSQKLMSTVNYRQMVQLLEGELDEPAANEEAIHHNIQLARKQLIWFRGNPAMKWFAIDTMDKATLNDAVASYIKECS